MDNGWVGVDLDGTLAFHDKWTHPLFIGKPILRMVKRVKSWIENGEDVRIFTARVSYSEKELEKLGVTTDQIIEAIQDWCAQHLGKRLPVTCVKDFMMIELWDDRAIQVIRNTGEIVEEL